MYRNESSNGDAVSWSFFVNAPAYTSNRCEPEFVMMRFGMLARLLLIASATGRASAAKSVRSESFEG